MSRGYGKTQRAILDYIATEPKGLNPYGVPDHCTIAEVAAHVYGSEPTEAQLVATRRAVRRLAADGTIEAAHSFVTPEVGRHLPERLQVQECDGDGCEYCAEGIDRFTGTWADESPPAAEGYDWDPSWSIDFWVKRGAAWHCGRMRRRHVADYDAVAAVLVRRPLTDQERQAEEDGRRAHLEGLAATIREAMGPKRSEAHVDVTSAEHLDEEGDEDDR